MIKSLHPPNGLTLPYLGLGPEAGPLPAFVYLSLSGEESLSLEPYNRPALALASNDLRVFSLTLPGHGDGFNKFHAMQYWADEMQLGHDLLGAFFDQAAQAINWLIENEIVESEKLAIGGLSRGGFIATHLAARIPKIHTLLGFAPLTELTALQEFASNPQLAEQAKTLDLIHLCDALTHVRNIRFYIGNRDERVSTDACYRFVRHLAEKGHEKRARHQKVELFISQSVGHKGHGTLPNLFEEGALWVKHHL